jgi:hypothetical protein
MRTSIKDAAVDSESGREYVTALEALRNAVHGGWIISKTTLAERGLPGFSE